MNVRLRPITEADLPDYVCWLNDPEVTEWTIREFAGVTLENERAWFAAKQAPACCDRVWAIEANGQNIGTCELHVHDDRGLAFFGIIIGDKHFWNRGCGTAATREAIRIGFEEMGLQRIYLRTLARNVRAQRCYEKCGFLREGLHRKAEWKRGEWVDVVSMAILREEWETQS